MDAMPVVVVRVVHVLPAVTGTLRSPWGDATEDVHLVISRMVVYGVAYRYVWPMKRSCVVTWAPFPRSRSCYVICDAVSAFLPLLLSNALSHSRYGMR